MSKTETTTTIEVWAKIIEAKNRQILITKNYNLEDERHEVVIETLGPLL